MSETGESRFRSLETFPLNWRWTDSRWNRLPDDALRDIKPFRESKARELWKRSIEFCDQSGLAASRFEYIFRFNTELGHVAARRWLLEQSSNLNQEVVVSWSDELAVLARWAVFCDYWDDFCYPASDDVTIWPSSEDWVLAYFHHEEFIFGRSLKATSEF